MSNDMSMFKKMKERITDEVNSATNRLQNMQIIDQLASSIGQQAKNDITPNQLLPEHHDSSSSDLHRNSQFSLIDDGNICGYNEEEELNSEISPQHELFNESSIKRLDATSSINPVVLMSNELSDHKERETSHSRVSRDVVDNSGVMMNVQELSSDIEDDLEETFVADKVDDDGPDIEIDLLSDKQYLSSNNKLDNQLSKDCISRYKTRYRNTIHGFRRVNKEFESEKTKLKKQVQDLSIQIGALTTELEDLKRQQPSSQQNSLNNFSEKNDKVNINVTQTASKSSAKIKSLEKLLAKCKESLKLKNSQIQSLKESLKEVEKFQESNQELKNELKNLKDAHETWTVSIAENKRVMHQEIESKNVEIDKLKGETNDIMARLNESNNKNKQLKLAIQDLESRMVSTSAAHQKEREGLIKELSTSKNNAIKQFQKECDLNIERVKLDMEKSIEALKLEILKKDEVLIKNASEQQQLRESQHALARELDESNKKFHEQLKMIENLSVDKDDLISNNKELTLENESLKEQLSTLEITKSDLEKQLIDFKEQNKDLDQSLQDKLSSITEKYQQDLHELNNQLNLMTTANDDQEKEISSLKTERDALAEKCRLSKSELDELVKKNDSLQRMLRENETDIQTHQEHLEQFSSLRQELDHSKKENASLLESLNDLKAELKDKNSDLAEVKTSMDTLNGQLRELKSEHENTCRILNDLKKEKESLIVLNEQSAQQRSELDKQLVVGIVSALKNLETPNTSPGSCKSFDSIQDGCNPNSPKKLPNPLIMLEELSAIALDKSNAQMTATQRLQAVLLENSMIGEELRRLKDEINQLTKEKTLEAHNSVEENENLLNENQALIHDQQAYEDKIKSLEIEIETMTKRLAEKIDHETLDAKKEEQLRSECETKLQEIANSKSVEAKNDDEKAFLLKKIGDLEQELQSCQSTEGGGDHTYQLRALQRVLQQYQEENQRLKENQKKLTIQMSQVQDSDSVLNLTEFEYLKNIGKEPLVLARVISAVFKFEKDQVDKICKIQETVQSALKQGNRQS